MSTVVPQEGHGVNSVFDNPRPVWRLWIAQAGTLLDVDLQMLDWIRNGPVRPVVHRVLFQASGNSQWYVWRSRKSDRRAGDGHTVLTCSGESRWQSTRSVATTWCRVGAVELFLSAKRSSKTTTSGLATAAAAACRVEARLCNTTTSSCGCWCRYRRLNCCWNETLACRSIVGGNDARGRCRCRSTATVRRSHVGTAGHFHVLVTDSDDCEDRSATIGFDNRVETRIKSSADKRLDTSQCEFLEIRLGQVDHLRDKVPGQDLVEVFLGELNWNCVVCQIRGGLTRWRTDFQCWIKFGSFATRDARDLQAVDTTLHEVLATRSNDRRRAVAATCIKENLHRLRLGKQYLNFRGWPHGDTATGAVRNGTCHSRA